MLWLQLVYLLFPQALVAPFRFLFPRLGRFLIFLLRKPNEGDLRVWNDGRDADDSSLLFALE